MVGEDLGRQDAVTRSCRQYVDSGSATRQKQEPARELAGLHWDTKMKMLLALLLSSSMTFAGQPASKEKEKKPAAIQDGSAAKSYIHKALYEYLEKPPYLAVELATPFLAKQVAGKDVWLSLVEFSCGTDHMNCVVCATVIIYDPATKQHRFMNPDDFASTVKKEPTNKEPTNKEPADKEATDKVTVDGDAI